MDDLRTLHAALLAVLASAPPGPLRAALIMALGAVEGALGLPRTFVSRRERRAERTELTNQLY